MNASLPPGVEMPRRASDSVPFGAGRPIRADSEHRFYLAKCEKVRKSKNPNGRPTIFKDSDELLHSCLEYMKWVDEHPLFETHQKFSSTTCKFYESELPKKRPYTVGALCLYLGIAQGTWDMYRRDDRFKSVTDCVDEAIRQQKFEGAAAGFFNYAIIARDLGLVEKQEVTNKNDKPVEKITPDMTPQEAADLYAKTRENNS